MKFEDDRNTEAHSMHDSIVVMQDTFLSGWGESHGISLAGWSCRREDVEQVLAWVKGRSDSSRVRVVDSEWKPQAGDCTACHIYVVNQTHPSLSQ